MTYDEYSNYNTQRRFIVWKKINLYKKKSLFTVLSFIIIYLKILFTCFKTILIFNYQMNNKFFLYDEVNFLNTCMRLKVYLFF